MKSGDIWYHLFPLGFLDAEQQNPTLGADSVVLSHRLPELLSWLDHWQQLGVTALMLGPVFESETHGYDVVDPFHVDRRLGDEADLVRLIDECHRRSMRVGLDVVLHHVGRGHPHFINVIEHGRKSEWCDWFEIDFDRPGYDGFWYANFEGHGQLVKLNHSNPQVLDWAADVTKFWIDRGVDAFRFDAAYAIPSRFLARLTDRIRAVHSDVLLLGEVIHGDYVATARASRLSTVTQYELWKAIWSGLNDRNFFELAHALERHGTFCQHFSPWNFVGNHDTTRIATQLADPRHVAHAVAVLLTVPGIPAIYAGDEQGATGTKYDREGGDEEIRRPLPLHPSEMAGDQLPIWQLHRDWIALRRDRPWLNDGQLHVTHLENRAMTLEVRSGDQRFVTMLNTDDQPATYRIPAGVHAVAGHAIQHPAATELPPHGWAAWSSV